MRRLIMKVLLEGLIVLLCGSQISCLKVLRQLIERLFNRVAGLRSSITRLRRSSAGLRSNGAGLRKVLLQSDIVSLRGL